MATPEKLFGQPSWVLSSSMVNAAITELGGHLAPVTFQLGKRCVQPFAIAPWAEESLDPAIPPMLQALRGDFFCAPFGGNTTPYAAEAHPPHGEAANRKWHFEHLQCNDEFTELHLSLETKVRPGRVDKRISLRIDETAIYSRHELTGMSGPMNLGHHAMLQFPAKLGSGRLTTSPMRHGQVVPVEFESRAMGGFTSLRQGATFERLEEVPLALGGSADISRYPARPGFEDLVMLTHAASDDFAWSAVTFPEEGYLWYALKDPRILCSTVLWLSNGGRRYAPWNGRHCGVMGIEDVTSYFHLGLAESAAPNSINAQGIPTVLELIPSVPLCVNTIMGVVAIPPSFDGVQAIERERGGICFFSSDGAAIFTKVNHHFLFSSGPTG